MAEYNEKLNSFKERITATSTRTPIQEVREIEIKMQDEVQLNVWIPKQLLQSLKLKAVHENTSIKKIVQTAIENFLSIVP